MASRPLLSMGRHTMIISISLVLICYQVRIRISLSELHCGMNVVHTNILCGTVSTVSQT